MARYVRSALRLAAAVAPASASSALVTGRQAVAVSSVVGAGIAAPVVLRTFIASPGPSFASRPYSTALTPEQEKALETEYEHVTGLEREEVEGILTGKSRFESEIPLRGAFGTSEAPFVVQSDDAERIVGCTGGVGDHEHDPLWFKLKVDAPFECPLCSQVFKLQQLPH